MTQTNSSQTYSFSQSNPLSQTRSGILATQQPSNLGNALSNTTRLASRASSQLQPTTRIKPRQWNASFINRTAGNVSDYSTYNFNRPAATVNLGAQGSNNQTVARLSYDFARDRPTQGVKKDFFAMQAWTRVNLKANQHYQLTSYSGDLDDGTRFLIKNRKTGEVTELAGDWQTSDKRDTAWSDIFQPTQSGQYDLTVQYYDQKGQAVVNVSLDTYDPNQVRQQASELRQLNQGSSGQLGRVLSDSGVNVRSQPSTRNNTPIDWLSPDEQFTILRQVQSTTDAVYSDWYEIETISGQQGYVVADDTLVSLVNSNTIGATDGQSGRVLSDSGVNLRSQPSSQGNSPIDWLSPDTRFTILRQVQSTTDATYPDWYEIETEDGQRGYVVADASLVGVGSDTTSRPNHSGKGTTLPTGDRSWLRVTQSGSKNADGLVKLTVDYVVNGVVVDELPAISGQPGKQYFDTADKSLDASMEPLPEGYWSLGTVEFASGVYGDYSTSWSDGLDGIGPVWVGMEPTFATKRHSIGIHLDNNGDMYPGTVGCIGILNKSDLKRLVSWFDDPDLAPTMAVIDWNLGTV